MTQKILLFCKGVAIGGANVIPGVSGGTIAFITGIYSRLISSLKACDMQAVRLLIRFEFRALYQHIDLGFLIPIVLGAFLGLISVGKLLDYIITLGPIYERYVWSFFFGLILASIYPVGKEIKTWDVPIIISGVMGLLIALSLAFLEPAQEKSSFFYLMLCGLVAIGSMLLPGLSGSFVLILMGNYRLIMLDAIPNQNLQIIVAIGIGAAIGFIVLSRFISFLLSKYERQTLATLTGFIVGSLLLIWPWKEKVYLLDDYGDLLLKNGEPVVTSYTYFFPSIDASAGISFLFIIVAAGLVAFITILGNRKVSS